MHLYEVAEAAEPHLRKNDFAGCECVVRTALMACPPSPFHKVLDLEFTNELAAVAQPFTKLCISGKTVPPVAALYTETNGFSINPQRWFFDVFGYIRDGGLEDLDWFAEWDTECEAREVITLTGMEELQAVYDSEPLDTDQANIAGLMVVVKFQKLIFTSRPYMDIGEVPVYSTAHGCEFIGRC